MARDEYENFQLLVKAGGESLRDVTVNASHLLSRKPSKEAASGQVNISLVGYVLTRPDDRRPWGKATKIGWWPDPLLPNCPFDVAAGETQPVRVTLFAPVGTPPGMYSGKLFVAEGGRRVAERAYRVGVFNVELPKKQKLRNAAFMPAGNLMAQYKVPCRMAGKPFLRLYERWATPIVGCDLLP
ncbi:MAG TPA: hypothetical protein VMX16_19340 [Terriglobia bacterium]|nr:hypothetical protein [Terriglobia bacterium]